MTVAAIAERDGRFLMVEEDVRGRHVLNNPAGHLEPSESFLDAVRRETLEETGWEFEPDAVIGIYLWKSESDKTMLRVAFHGRCVVHHPNRPLDKDILGARWLSRPELAAGAHILRSPMVLRCIDDYLAGRRYPLELLTHLADQTLESGKA